MMRSCRVVAIGPFAVEPKERPATRYRSDRVGLRSLSAPSQVLELGDHPLVDAALERHHEGRQPVQFLPAPFDEFRLMASGRMRDVDFAFVAGKAQREPFLRLAAILAAPGMTGDVRRDVVVSHSAISPSRSTDVMLVSSRNSRRAAGHGSSPGSMPPCGNCHTCVASMCSGPSMRRPMNARPARLSTMRPAQGR